VEERFYGELGEVVQTVKSFTSQPHTLGFKATTLYSYDSFGRMLDLTYPDGEKVTYTYDAGGSVKTVAGIKAGTSYVYVSHLGYDEFEQRARMIQGNGVETRYTYDPRTRRLTDVVADLPAAKPLQRLHYGYDPAGNVVTLANNVPVPPSNQMGGPTSFQFAYDDLYQLVHAAGDYQFPPGKDRKFTVDTTYDEIGNIRRKTQSDTIFQSSGSSVPQKPTSYDVAYDYAGARPHATSHIGTRTYSYDADGNQTAWTDDGNGQRRDLTWNEEDRLKSMSDDGHTSSYLYDANGTRTHKRVENGQTIYVNQFYSIKNGEVATKHFFVGETRIASKPEQSSGTGKPTEQVIYFYNPDHLGSSNYVTDQRALIFQHDEYFPSGETWVEESSTTDRTPYLFTGKELDETGLYYFGARYYDPRTGVWQSTDPILARYMRGGPSGGVFAPRNLALYTYAWNSPVLMRDPDGRKLELTGPDENVKRLVEGTNKSLDLVGVKRDPKDGSYDVSQVVEGPLTERDQAFANEIHAVAKDPKTVTIDVVSDDPSVMGGQFDTGTIDVTDFENLSRTVDVKGLPSSPFPPTMAGLVTHEVVEQFQKQVLGITDYDVAHDPASKAEGRVEGMKPLPQAFPTSRHGVGSIEHSYLRDIQKAPGVKEFRFRFELQGPNQSIKR
jgi:RHS repeat-associated protein